MQRHIYDIYGNEVEWEAKGPSGERVVSSPSWSQEDLVLLTQFCSFLRYKQRQEAESAPCWDQGISGFILFKTPSES